MQKYPALVWHCQTLLSIVDTPSTPLPSQGPHGGKSSIWQHHPCLLGVPMVRRVQYGYITPAFSGSPWWGEFNMAT